MPWKADAVVNSYEKVGNDLREFAKKVGTFLSRAHGESYEGSDKELDELFELCEKYAPTAEASR